MSADGLRSPAIRHFLDRPRFASIATIDPDGAPFTAVVWYALGASTITINSAEGRRWPANLRRDPRISLTVEQGYDYVTVLGRVTIDDDQGRAQRNMAEIAARYITKPDALAARLADFKKQQRIMFEIHPHAVLAHGVPAERRSEERTR
jgi:PPOX class probable F420-dependent enzyme